MRKGRLYTIAVSEIRFLITQPVFWILVVLLGVLTLSLGPAVFIPSEPSPGGESVWINSRYALLQFFAFCGLLGYTVFASFLAGLSLMRDEDAGIAPLMNSTPLSAFEYVLGKMMGIAVVLGGAVLWHITVTMLSYEFLPAIQRELATGPFNLWHYLSMGVLGAVPGMWAAVGLTFLATALIRRSLVVYAVPVLVFITAMSYALVIASDTSWSLPAMLLDPSGLRWMFHTVFETDQGVAYYNTSAIAIDSIYLANRLIMLGIGALSVILAIPATSRWMRRPDKQLLPNWLTRKRRLFTKDQHQQDRRIPITLPEMHSASPSSWRETLYIATMEWKEAVRQPIYYLVCLVLVALLMENANESASSILGTSLYLTAGSIAVSNLPLLSGFLCILVLMFVVEASYRDQRSYLASVVHATPVRSASFVMGRLLAGMGLVVLVVIGIVLLFLVQLSAQGSGFATIYPFLLTWGGVLIPSLALWLACMILVTGAGKRWVTAYAIGLSLFALSVYATSRGWLDWSTNWLLWGSLRWSDMGSLVQDQHAIVLNRAWVLLLTSLIAGIAILRYRRVVRDRQQQGTRSWRRLGVLNTATLAVLALAVISLMGYTRWQVYNGFQGEVARQNAQAYWQQNMRTWRDYQPPGVIFMDLKIELEPASRFMAVDGAYTLVNQANHRMEVIPITMPPAFEQITWQLNGADVLSEDRAGLHILSLDTPLSLGDSIQVGFAYEAHLPDGMSRNGGARSHFILPAGVLLSNARGDFLPVIGYEEHRGITEQNSYAPVDQDPRFTHLNDNQGSQIVPPYMSRISITIPDRYMATATGTQTRSVQEDGKQTTVWETQYPVRAVNVMAGEWREKKRGTNAIYYHPAHEYNADMLLDALVDARSRYSEWFFPYPWGSLRINEFANAGTGATAYPTNISFSEGMGFLTRPGEEAYLPYVVAAHEVAHQWWGHLVSPAYSPGADLLTEAMANYATIRLLEVEKGEEARDTFLQWLNDRYLAERRIDREKPLSELTLDFPDAESVIYNKGALVLWKMHQHLGEESMDAAVQEFIGTFALHTGQQPGLDDFLQVVRTHATDAVEFDQFVDEWIESVTDVPLLN